MSIFKDRMEFDSEVLIKTTSRGAFLSRCMTITGDVKSCEPITIEGIINGNIVCEDIVIIEKGAIVNGKIEAKEVRVDGKLIGPIEATLVEVTDFADIQGYILTKAAVINGKVDGDILAKETLEIGKNGYITTLECKSKVIFLEGKIVGNIEATELLDIKKSASINGDILTKELKSEPGSKILGSIKSYKETDKIIKQKGKKIKASKLLEEVKKIS